MKDLIKFILKYGNFLVFIILEVVAFLLFLNNNDYPRSGMLSTANRAVGSYYNMISEVTTYFSLHTTNEELAKENVALQTQLQAYLQQNDSVQDWQPKQGRFDYLSAKVVHCATYSTHNYFTIDRGSTDGLSIGMGVCTAAGAVGVISTLSDHYAVVVPLIHSRSQLSCRLKKDDYIATLHWEGHDIGYAKLEDVAIHEVVDKGDTIVTSGLTNSFPEGVMVGVIEDCSQNTGDGYYDIRVRLSVDFRRIKFVEVIRDRYSKEIEGLVDGMD